MSELTIITIVVSVFVGAAGMYMLWRVNSHNEDRLSKLERRLAESEQREAERQAAMEAAMKRARPHHAYNTAAGLEDAASLLVEGLIDLQAEQARMETALSILQTVRRDPHGYNPDKKS